MIRFATPDDYPDIPDNLKRSQEGKSVNDLPFHPLADLFPLIEGTEFDELVASIKENGLREPIVTYEGAILDGRNRYRACRTAGVSPMTHAFTGRDPVRFVIDKNVNRRHLTPSQRAMIAAQFATLKVGDVSTQHIDVPQENDGHRIRRPSLSAAEAAEAMQVGVTAVQSAKTVLAEGTSEEIDAVKQGRASAEKTAEKIRARRPLKVSLSIPKRPRRGDNTLSSTGKNPERIEQMRINGKIWSDLRAAIEMLAGMPRAIDVVAIVRAHNADKARIIDDHLIAAFHFLQEFSDAWTSPGAQARIAQEQDRDGRSDARNGGRAA